MMMMMSSGLQEEKQQEQEQLSQRRTGRQQHFKRKNNNNNKKLFTTFFLLSNLLITTIHSFSWIQRQHPNNNNNLQKWREEKKKKQQQQHQQEECRLLKRNYIRQYPQWSSSSSLIYGSSSSSGGGDRIRAATGIRPSLHPMTINALSEALLLRSSSKSSKSSSNITIDITAENVSPMDVAMTAGNLAADALFKRHAATTDNEEDKNEAPTTEESQVVAGRVVGVVMRLPELETLLSQRVSKALWVRKYREQASFGLLPIELLDDDTNDNNNNNNNDDDNDNENNNNNNKIAAVYERIKDDPYFRMCRAECLLALFLHTVERPKLDMIQEELIDGSVIDFIDSERLQVLLIPES